MGVHRDLYGSCYIGLCRKLGNCDILPSLAVREARMSEPAPKVDSIILKWGTLKGWDIQTEKGMALLRRYVELGASYGAAQQRDTPEKKEIICQLIDCC